MNDSFSALIAGAMDGSKKVIAQKDKQREVVIKKLRILGRYVEESCNGDKAVFASSGFQAASKTKAPSLRCLCRSSAALIMASSPEKS